MTHKKTRTILAVFLATAFLAILFVVGNGFVDDRKNSLLEDGAFARWLAEDERYKLFSGIAEARRAWRFSVWMERKIMDEAADRETYEHFLDEWKIRQRGGKSI